VLRGLLICLIFSLSQIAGRADQSSANLPQPVQSLREQIQGKTADQNRKIISTALGTPSRDLGSGVHILCWDFPNGSLIGDVAPKFVFKSGQVIWLIKTHNPLRENLLGSYEMSSTSNSNWLGDIALRPEGKYEFTKADVHQDGWFDGQASNYFLRHPRGIFKIDFPSGLNSEDLLESVTDGTVVAKLSFTSEDGANEVFSIATDTESRLLSFSSSEPVKFRMMKPWQNILK
jgi:hypothetical protein